MRAGGLQDGCAGRVRSMTGKLINPVNLSSYAYAGHRPLISIDPDGRFWWLVVPIVVVALTGCGDDADESEFYDEAHATAQSGVRRRQAHGELDGPGGGTTSDLNAMMNRYEEHADDAREADQEVARGAQRTAARAPEATAELEAQVAVAAGVTGMARGVVSGTRALTASDLGLSRAVLKTFEEP